MNAETIGTVAGFITLLIVVIINVVTVMRGQKTVRAFAVSTEAIANSTAAIPNHVTTSMREQMQGFLDIYSASRDEFNRQLGNLQAQITQSKADLNEEKERSRIERNKFAADIADQKKLTDAALLQVEQLKRKVDELEQTIKAKNEQHEIDIQTIDALRNQLTQTKESLTVAQTELATNRAAMEGQIKELQERVTTLEKQVNDMAAERERLIKERDEARKERDLFKGQAETLASTVARQDEHIRTLETRIKQLEDLAKLSKPEGAG